MNKITGFFRRPIPLWIILFVPLLAVVVPTWYGSINLNGGTISDPSAPANTCVGVSSARQYVYGSNCVVTNTANTGNLIATGYVEGGSATAPTCIAGDVCASRSVSTGELQLGGSTSGARLDYGLNIAGQLSLVTGAGTQSNFNTELGSTLGPVEPCFLNNGLACGSTIHHVHGTCAFSASTTCSISLSGASVYAAGNTYSCSITSPDTAHPVFIEPSSGSAMTAFTTGGAGTFGTVFDCDGT